MSDSYLSPPFNFLLYFQGFRAFNHLIYSFFGFVDFCWFYCGSVVLCWNDCTKITTKLLQKSLCIIPFLFFDQPSFHTFQCAFYHFRFLLYHIIFSLCSLFTNKLLLTSLNYLINLTICIISSIDFPLFVLLYFSLSSTIVSSLLFRVKSFLRI